MNLFIYKTSLFSSCNFNNYKFELFNSSEYNEIVFINNNLLIVINIVATMYPNR